MHELTTSRPHVDFHPEIHENLLGVGAQNWGKSFENNLEMLGNADLMVN